MKVVVLLGGASPEREVSLWTGEAVVKALTQLGHQAIPIDPNRALPKKLLELAPDFVWIALHGSTGEDGTIQGLLDWLDLPYNGSGVLASACGMDKVVSKDLLHGAGLPVIPYRVLEDPKLEAPKLKSPKAFPQECLEALGLPMVVKPAQAGSSVGVSIVQEIGEFPAALEKALRYSPQALAETFIPGKEITVTVFGEKTYPAIEMIPQVTAFYDYEDKYRAGGSRHLLPPDLPKTILDLLDDHALKVYRAFKCSGVARVDFRVTPEGQAWVLEVNTLPGMTNTSLVPEAMAAVGISFEQLVQLSLEEGLSRRPQK
jgi:D-alanine-D-alanine ligase